MPSTDKSPSPQDEHEQAQSAPNDNREMTPERYISVYNSPHIQQVTSPHSFTPSAYPPNAHWQYPASGYATVPPTQYYQQANPVMPTGAPSGQYVASYAGWSNAVSNLPPQSVIPQNQGYQSPPDSPSLREAGPARTKRIRRRSAQDILGLPQPLDGEILDVPEASSPTITKRTKPGTSGSSSSESKSFPCAMCSATFTRKGDCLRHTRSVHTRETPYDCQGCGEMFSRSDMRGKHWKMDPNCEKSHWREVCKAMGREGLLDS